ncbi:MAG: hypothetical protein GAK37_03703 [Pseudomonas sp.]|nr:MAG: hypothetical protein GAK37_03703 [Pseudomonas sp.]
MKSFHTPCIKNRTAQMILLVGMSLFIGACTTPPQQWTYPNSAAIVQNVTQPDPPCTTAGYFRSSTPGMYYQCVFSAAHNRWFKYIYSCPAGKNFNETTQKCE